VVRELKGAGLMILIALGMQRESAKRAWIEGAVGLSDKTVARALDYLHEYGYVRPIDGGWKLTREGASLLKQLAPVCEEAGPEQSVGTLPVEDDAGSAPDAEVGEQTDARSPRPAAIQPGAALKQGSRESCDRPVLPPGVDIDADGSTRPRNFSGLCCFKESINLRSESIDREKQKQRACSPEIFRAEQDPNEQRAIWEELRLAGIRQNARTEALAQKPGMTAGYVRAHRLQMQEQGQEGARWTGLLITILERGEPAPEQAESFICRVCHQYPCACEAEGEAEAWEEGYDQDNDGA
jgi:hypothetical protein